MSVETIELSDAAWDSERDAITNRFFGIDAKQFMERFRTGDYEAEQTDGLVAVLAFFPELD
jgi:hypothetical protein